MYSLPLVVSRGNVDAVVDPASCAVSFFDSGGGATALDVQLHTTLDSGFFAATVHDLTVDSARSCFVAAIGNGTLHTVDLATLETRCVLNSAGRGDASGTAAAFSVNAVAASPTPQSHVVCAGTSDGLLRFWSLKTARSTVNAERSKGDLDDSFRLDSSSSSSSDGDEDGGAAAAERARLEEEEALYQRLVAGHASSIHKVSFSACGRLVATASRDGTVRVWDASSHERMAVLQHGAAVTAVCFSPADSAVLATACVDGTLCVWQRGKQTHVHKLVAAINDVCFARNGEKLACAVDDMTVRQFNFSTTTTAALQQAFVAKHQHRVLCVDYSPDGALLASGGGDDKVFVWESAHPEGRQLARLRLDSDVTSVLFTDNRTLLAATEGNAVSIFTISRVQQQQQVLATVKVPQMRGGVDPGGAWFSQDGTQLLLDLGGAAPVAVPAPPGTPPVLAWLLGRERDAAAVLAAAVSQKQQIAAAASNDDATANKSRSVGAGLGEEEMKVAASATATATSTTSASGGAPDSPVAAAAESKKRRPHADDDFWSSFDPHADDAVQRLEALFPPHFVFQPQEIRLGATLSTGGFGDVRAAIVAPRPRPGSSPGSNSPPPAAAAAAAAAAGANDFIVAAKSFRSGGVRAAVREAQLCMTLHHRFCVQCHGICVDKSRFGGVEVCLLLELADCDLAAVLKRWRAPPWSWVLRTAKQIVEGVAYLHSRNILWLDAKPSNCLICFLSGSLKSIGHEVAEAEVVTQVKIADFGASHAALSITDPTSGMSQLAFTLRYASSEQLRGTFIDGKCDTYSLGALLFLLCSGKEPWAGCDREEILSGRTALVDTLVPRAGCPPRLLEVTRRCLAPRDERPRHAIDVFHLLADEHDDIPPFCRPQSGAGAHSDLDGSFGTLRNALDLLSPSSNPLMQQLPGGQTSSNSAAVTASVAGVSLSAMTNLQ